MNVHYSYIIHMSTYMNRKETWNVAVVDKNRAQQFAHTNAQDPIPVSIPNAEARWFSDTLSAYILSINFVKIGIF